jgi:hypothetical protein
MPGKHFRSLTPLWATLGTLLVGCAGPATLVDNPDGHPVFVDGRAEPRSRLPFSYYGTVQVDALPKDRDGLADFTRQPTRQFVQKPPPAAPWLFPFDFAAELALWPFSDPEVPVARVELPATDPTARANAEFRPTGLELVNERALQARISR